MKSTTDHLGLPFFDDVHRERGQGLADWIPGQHLDESDDRQACREWVGRLGDKGWLRYCVPAGPDDALGGALDRLDSRALVILRETLAFHSPLADFAFAMQGLGDFQLTQARLGEMAALVDAAALLTYRAAWLRDESERLGNSVRVTAEAAMAKMTATENAQCVIDMALQMHGGLGVKVGTRVESLYRDIRSLRIYEGATEVQQLIIGKAVLKS